ncbi:MAG TPA: sigma-70 family RNA polymerase sigma factor [Thermoanaerobaculia bacterium]|nr:sigma-70 family RNA polymerase sigma factor [Thermoanaerobaculia bacterium]
MAAFRMSNPSDAPSNEALIERTLAGDGAAFGMLMERFQRRIYRVAFAVVRDDVEADTITQDTFIQAYTHLARFEGRAELETWLTRIAINRARDVLRRRRFVSLFTLRNDEDGESEVMLEPVDERPDPERQMSSSQLRAAIQRAERGLSAQQKVIFRLRHYENLSLEDIATHLGLQSGTVRAHLFRAIHKVRRELAEWRTTRRMDHEPAIP